MLDQAYYDRQCFCALHVTVPEMTVMVRDVMVAQLISVWGVDKGSVDGV